MCIRDSYYYYYYYYDDDDDNYYVCFFWCSAVCGLCSSFLPPLSRLSSVNRQDNEKRASRVSLKRSKPQECVPPLLSWSEVSTDEQAHRQTDKG